MTASAASPASPAVPSTAAHAPAVPAAANAARPDRGASRDGERFDIVMLGSGSTAFGVALKAAELGATAAMTEERTLGGTCVNRGCLPSKNLIEAAKLFHDAHQPRYPGLLPKGMGLDFAALIGQKDEVIDHYRDRKYGSIVCEDQKIQVFEGHAEFIDAHTVQVGDRRVYADTFVVATGSRPSVPPIEGLDVVPYLTSDLLTVGEGLELAELPKSLIVIGSGYIALELGQMFHRFGTEVMLLERGPTILGGYEPIVGETLLQLLRDEGLTIRLNATTKRVRRDSEGVVVTITAGGQQRELRAERLLVATGRVPNTENLGLEKVGVETDERGWIKVDDEFRTTAPHISAAGDVIGTHTASQLATPVGAHDGAIVAYNAIGGEHRKAGHRVVPRVIFTDPQIAVVGLTEAEAEVAGVDCRCQEVPMELVPRAGAIRDTRGVIKMVIELIHVYPTMAEALKIVAIAFYKDPSKLSCCAE